MVREMRSPNLKLSSSNQADQNYYKIGRESSRRKNNEDNDEAD
jgi:hypothetical protein